MPEVEHDGQFLHETHEDLAQDLVEGKWIIQYRLAIVILISAGIIIFYNFTIGSNKLPTQIVRFLLTCLMCRAIYRGVNWVKHLGVFLFGIGGMGFVFLGYLSFTVNISTATQFFSLGLSYIGVVQALVANQKVKAFLLYQRQLRGAD